MITIRALQHYLYCPRRWYLLHEVNLWQDNAFTVLAQIIHKHAHEGGVLKQTQSVITLSEVTIFSERWQIYGKTDVLELRRCKNGVAVEGFDGLFQPSLVEYKPTAPKDGKQPVAELLQLLAQKICVDELFGCDCRAFFFYSDVHRRVQANFDGIFPLFKQTVEAVNKLKQSGQSPSPQFGKKCSGCSMRDVCMPRCVKSSSVKQMILGASL